MANKSNSAYLPTIHLDVIDDASRLSKEERKDVVTSVALTAGIQAAVAAAALAGVAVIAGQRFSPWFRRSFGPSGKTALVIMPAAFSYTLVSEQATDRLANPHAFRRAYSQRLPSTLTVPQLVANYAYVHPVKVLACASIPAYIAIFALKGGEKHLSIMQRIFHTRVIGQATVLVFLLSIMAFHDYMDNHGLYKEEWETELERRKKT